MDMEEGHGDNHGIDVEMDTEMNMEMNTDTHTPTLPNKLHTLNEQKTFSFQLAPARKKINITIAKKLRRDCAKSAISNGT